jgi:hypothetical protein
MGTGAVVTLYWTQAIQWQGRLFCWHRVRTTGFVRWNQRWNQARVVVEATCSCLTTKLGLALLLPPEDPVGGVERVHPLRHELTRPLGHARQYGPRL